MTLWVPMFATPATWSIPDYKGGESPILVILAAVGVVAAVGVMIGLYVRGLRRQYAFDQLCRRWGLTDAERGYLLGFIRRFHIKDPLTLIEHPGRFESFVSSLAHYFEGAALTEEDLRRQIDFFGRISRKLAIPRPAHHGLPTSRVIQAGDMITARIRDPQTGATFFVDARVLENDEFFLGITPPAEENARATADGGKPKVNVTFVWKGDHYSYDTRLARAVNAPEMMWLLRHSHEVVRGEPHRELSLPATISTTAGGHTNEWAVTITSLNPDDCTITSRDPHLHVSPQETLLLDFEIDGASFSCRGELSHSQGLMRVRFKSMDPEVRLALLHVLRKDTEKVTT